MKSSPQFLRFGDDLTPFCQKGSLLKASDMIAAEGLHHVVDTTLGCHPQWKPDLSRTDDSSTDTGSHGLATVKGISAVLGCHLPREGRKGLR